MKKEERQTQLLEMINTEGNVSVSDIMETMNVSDMTVRRDLNELAHKGLVIRTHGGAQRVISVPNARERTHTEKKSLHEAEKTMIALKAASLINEGETVFLGPGTTLEQLACALCGRNIRVVTNSLPVFEILNQSSSVDLILTGGEYRHVTGAFVGSAALCTVESMRFSKAFISANGIIERGVYTYSEAEGTIQKTALNRAAIKILLADSSKFGSYDFCEFYQLNGFDTLITDDAADQNTLADLQKQCNVIVCPTE